MKCTRPWKTLVQRKCPDGPAAAPGMLLTVAVGSFHHLLLPPAPQENRKDMSPFMFPFCCCLKTELCRKHAPPSPKSRRGFVFLAMAGIYFRPF